MDSMPSKQSHARRGYDDDDYDIPYTHSSSHHSGSKKKGGFSACGGRLGGHLDPDVDDASHAMDKIKSFKKKKSEAFKKAQDEFGKTSSRLVSTFEEIKKHLKNLNSQLFEFKKKWKKTKGDGRREAYNELTSHEGVRTADAIYKEIMSFVSHEGVSVKELRAPGLEGGQSYHPRKISFWYYKAKRTLLTAQYLAYKKHGTHSDEHAKRFVHFQDEGEKIVEGLTVWYEAHPEASKPQRRARPVGA